MPRPFLRLRGRLRADGCYDPLPGWETTRLARRCHAAADLSLQLLDESGAVVAKGCVERRSGLCTIAELHSSAIHWLTGHVVLHPRAVKLVLACDGIVIHEAPIHSEPPEVRSLHVVQENDEDWCVQWEVAHPSSLRFGLAFVDPLRRVIPIARDLTETSYRLDTRRLPGGGPCRVALLATDGIRSCSARSEPFQLPARAPNLYVHLPAPDTVLPPDQPFSLHGSAQDLAGRSLPDSCLVWSINGAVVARGTRLAVGGPLPTGEHVIALSFEGGDQDAVAVVKRKVTISPRTEELDEWDRIRASLDRVC